MRLVPRQIDNGIRFFEVHTASWSADPAAIGTSAAAVDDLAAKVAAARADYIAQRAAQQAARSATQKLRISARAMARAGSDIVKQIRAKAASGGKSIYSLALIPAPQNASPLPPPGTPAQFSVELLADGALVLRWKCANPSGSTGTIYQVYRRLTPPAGGGEFTFIGSTGSKQFIDSTLPAGGAPGGTMTYQIIAVRSTAAGAPAQFNVNFGGGGATATMVTAGKSKLAA